MANGGIFFSYSRDDSSFVSSLAKSLREAGAQIWLDNLDIQPGHRWDESIEAALKSSHTLLVILSKSSVKSDNVMDEVSYALEENKKVVPVLLEECDIPFRLRRLQYANFTEGHEKGVASLIKALKLDKQVAHKLIEVTEIPSTPKQKSKPTPSEPAKSPIQQKDIPETPLRQETKSSNKTLLYVILGLAVVVILVVIGLVGADSDSEHEIPAVTETHYNNEVIETGNMPTDDTTIDFSETAINQDWTYAKNLNTIEGYIQFVSTYGKNNAYYNEAFTRMKNMFSDSGYVKYGIVNVEQYFTKTLYFEGTELTIPVQGDFISPKMENEIWKNNYTTGYYVQPGRYYLVLDVATDNNNVVWVHLAI
ncbi:toll/interleukin-1 receptor domain-containing protein [Aequorivita marina]|uniref:toll/interleukin-1 receptor domain-containing protein n=1 Tax=Aequorivita marina TaxID=3073654 RepID=UPI0028749E2D|nr:toll/interleukin-1 receptor domain-containing protein [Aequorivita sp. S2608]MDS1297682.1 toll/interleukin-1 receptor domain-containing protein [Aequorivita sp. S2608]